MRIAPFHAWTRSLLVMAALILWGGSLSAAEPGWFQGNDNAIPPPLRTISVSSMEELTSAWSEAKPGDLIEVADGVYTSTESVRLRANGTPEHPIVIRAKNRGKAVYSGPMRWRIEGAKWGVLEGFVFTHADGGKGLEIKNSEYFRITRNHFRLAQIPDKSKTHWVYFTQKTNHMRVDHNLFEDKHIVGNFVAFDGDKPSGGKKQVSQYNRIDHNHFRNMGPRAKNGLEVIRIGDSGMSMSSGFNVVEMNLFENCDGDPEVVSVKSCDNIVRNNTFRDCMGALCLRHGNRNVAHGNFFFQAGKKPCGGIRFYGDDHKIFNNYFEGLTGKTDETPLALSMGDTDTGPLDDRFRPHRVIVAFNTFVDCGSPTLLVGYDDGGKLRMPSIDCVIANNLFVGAANPIIKELHPQENLTWEGNIIHAKAGGIAGISLKQNEMRVVDPLLVREDGVFRLSEKSPAIGTAAGTYGFVRDDCDGQPRDATLDVGADEFAQSGMKRRPLTASDVGVAAP